MTRVLVCGGRDFNDVAFFEDAMQRIHETYNITLVIHGAAKGADLLASEWAQARGISQTACPAAWGAYGKAAGPMRNQYMIDVHKPAIVVAFPGGRGTADMTQRAQRSGVLVLPQEQNETKT